MSLSPEDIAQTQGPNASAPLGQVSAMESERKAIEQAGSARSSGPQGQPQPVGPTPPPMSPPIQPAPMTPESIDTRLNPDAVFQELPAFRDPWRTWLRNAAAKPGAGPELRMMARSIDHQRGPLDPKAQGGPDPMAVPRVPGG